MKKHGANYSVSYTHDYTFPKNNGVIQERTYNETYETHNYKKYGAERGFDGYILKNSYEVIENVGGEIENKTYEKLGVVGTRDLTEGTRINVKNSTHHDASFRSVYGSTEEHRTNIIDQTVTIPTHIDVWTETKTDYYTEGGEANSSSYTQRNSSWITDYDFSDKVYGLKFIANTFKTFNSPSPFFIERTRTETGNAYDFCCPPWGQDPINGTADWYKVRALNLTWVKTDFVTKSSQHTYREFMPWNRYCAHAVFTRDGKFGVETYYKRTDDEKICPLITTHTITYSYREREVATRIIEGSIEETYSRFKVAGTRTEFVTLQDGDIKTTVTIGWSVQIPNYKFYSRTETYQEQVGVKQEKDFDKNQQTGGVAFPDPYFERNLTTIETMLDYTFKQWYLEKDERIFDYPSVAEVGVLDTQEYETEGWYYKSREANTKTTTAWAKIPPEHKGGGYGTYEAAEGYALYHRDMGFDGDISYQIFKKLVWTQDTNVEWLVKPYAEIKKGRNNTYISAHNKGVMHLSHISSTRNNLTSVNIIRTYKTGGYEGISVYLGNDFYTWGTDINKSVINFSYENIEEQEDVDYNGVTVCPKYNILPNKSLYLEDDIHAAPYITNIKDVPQYELYGSSITQSYGFTNNFHNAFIVPAGKPKAPDDNDPMPSAVWFDFFAGGWKQGRINGGTVRDGILLAMGAGYNDGRTFSGTYRSAMTRTVVEHGTEYNDKRYPDLIKYSKKRAFQNALNYNADNSFIGSRQLGFIDYDNQVYNYKPSIYFGKTYKLKDNTFHRFVKGDAIYLFSQSSSFPYISRWVETSLGDEILDEYNEPSGKYETISDHLSRNAISTVYETFGSSDCAIDHYETYYSRPFSAYKIITEDIFKNKSTVLAYESNGKYFMRDSTFTDLVYAKSEKTAYVFMTQHKDSTGSFIQQAKLFMTAKSNKEIKNEQTSNHITVGSNILESQYYDLTTISNFTQLFWTYFYSVITNTAKLRAFTNKSKVDQYYNKYTNSFNGAFGTPFSVCGGKNKTFYLNVGTIGERYQTAKFTELQNTNEHGSIKGYYEPEWEDTEYKRNEKIVKDDLFLIRKWVPPITTLHDKFTFKSGCAPYVGTGQIWGDGEVVAVKQFKLTVGKNSEQYAKYLPKYSTYEE